MSHNKTVNVLRVLQALRVKSGQPGTLARFGGIAALALVAPFAHAQSAPAFTNAPAIIRAGPSQDYPAVAQLQGGTPLQVMGCVQGYTWCDVSLPGLRGWVYGGRLNYAYQGNPVPLMSYGPQIGLPIIGFSFGSYWGDHYRAQPWYGQRDRWEHIAPPRPEWHGGPPPGRGPEWHGGPPPGRGPEWHGGPQPRPQEFHGGPPQGVRLEQHGGPQPGPRPEEHRGPPPGGGGHPPEGPHGGGGQGGHPPQQGGHGDGGDHRGGPPHG